MWIPHTRNARDLRYSRAPPRRPARPRREFIFNLSMRMRESKASPVVVCLHHAGGRKRFKRRLGVSSSVGHCCQHFWVGWGPNQIKGGLRRGKCQRDKQALQIFLGRLQLDDADHLLLCTMVPKLHVPAAELWKELVLDVHGTCHLDKHGRRCM